MHILISFLQFVIDLVYYLCIFLCSSAHLSGYEPGEDIESLATGNFSKVAMETWSVDDVGLWVTSLGLAEHVQTFRDNAIDGRELLALTGDDLQTSLGIGLCIWMFVWICLCIMHPAFFMFI